LKEIKSSTGNFDYNAFTQYLQGPAGGNRSLTTAKAITADIEHFISQSDHMYLGDNDNVIPYSA